MASADAAHISIQAAERQSFENIIANNFIEKQTNLIDGSEIHVYIINITSSSSLTEQVDNRNFVEHQYHVHQAEHNTHGDDKVKCCRVVWCRSAGAIVCQ